MKKNVILAMALAVTMVSLVGCSFSKTVTTSETTVDADGNETTVTTTEVNENGKKTTETTTETKTADEAAEEDFYMATIAFDNESGVDFAGLYFSSALQDGWGDDILGEYAPLASGEQITFDSIFRYTVDDTLWDILAVDSEGNECEFDGVDMAVASDPENISITFIYDEESQSYSAVVE